MQQPSGAGRKTLVLAVGGGLGFWLANLVVSLTPVAAEYRTASSIVYIPMLVAALLGGLVLGTGVSYALLRFFDRIPARSPILKSLLLSTVALVMVTTLVEVPAKLLTPTGDAWRYFLIGTTFNVVRFAALGVVIGYLYDKVDSRATASLWLLGRGLR